MATPNILSGLQTEERNPRSTNIDTVSTLELCQIFNDEDASIASVVRDCLSPIAGAIDCLSQRVRSGGRVIYVGAGTSGRLGVLDASEIPPTYSAPPSQFVGLIAGGDVALRSAREGAEDSVEAGVADLKAINIDGEKDSLIGIASSGRTPYVLGCLEFAKSKGCATVGIACTSPSALGQHGNVDYLIEAVTGPEIVTGSTRMKAGTATKLILNMISSGIMIRVGKTFGNIMVDVKPTNIKLEHRARRIIREIIGPEHSHSDAELDQVLAACDKSVKLAAVVLKFGISPEEARSRLQTANGVLATLIKEEQDKLENSVNGGGQQSQVVICVDAGGSRCRATILHSSGEYATGESGPCNVADSGSKAAAAEIKLAIERAAKACSATRNETLTSINVASLWVGIAGGDRKNTIVHLRSELELLLPRVAHWRITNDLELLATVAGEQTVAKDIVVVISGTGSIAIHYQRQDSKFIRVARAGGWGPLLGDDGSGFDIGRKAIRSVLQQLDVEDARSTSAIDPLRKAIVQHYRPHSTDGDDYDLLSSILVGESNGTHSPSEAKRRIASCAHLVIATAGTSAQSASIIKTAQSELLALVQTVAKRSHLNTGSATIVLAGGVLQSTEFRSEFAQTLVSAGVEFREIKAVEKLTLDGARYLAAGLW